MRRVRAIGLVLAYTALLTATILTSTGCAFLNRSLPKLPDGRVDVVKLLTWTADGFNQACSQEWLTQTQCVYAQDAVNVAVAVARAHLGDADRYAVYAAVLKSLQDSEAMWPPDANARLKDFFDWVIQDLRDIVQAHAPTLSQLPVAK